ncbi:GNAT family N-acetyltransferase [Streptomyces sp. A1547]|uniref:GNAT family N-acetyltransferase n=1 Tax=Streptomyces sp. A1547 TaxID=2563105 RepID=UPI00109E3771|nr:GNAT family N-acetyltransferase [Streptomyces sp. A1547]THA32883.1 GNAT family N-acetyltransferase [Streptomyces sp. A1547]
MEIRKGQKGDAIEVATLRAGSWRTGFGTGGRLLVHALAWAAEEHPARPVYLEVLRANTRAIAFYERHGALRTWWCRRPLRMPGATSRTAGSSTGGGSWCAARPVSAGRVVCSGECSPSSSAAFTATLRGKVMSHPS